MRLVTFRIRNFKSIIDTGNCHLSTSDNILVLAGQNEAGKTAVIQALIFFKKGATKEFERLLRRQNLSPEVTCSFELTKDEIEELFVQTNNESVKKYLLGNRGVSFVRGDVEHDNFKQIVLCEDDASKLEALFAEPSPISTEVAETTETEASSKEATQGHKRFISLQDFLVGKIKEFTFYDSFKDLLPGEVKISEIAKHSAIDDFEKVFQVDFRDVVKQDPRTIQRVEQRLAQNASDNLNTYWTQKLEEGGKYRFLVKIVPQAANPEVDSRIEFTIDRDDGDPLFLEQKSHGFRWFSAFNLRLRAIGANSALLNNLVILIDEPGQGLHERAQRDVKRVIEELASNGAQIIYTTHHPNLIGTQGNEFARIRLVSNSKEIGTKVETVAQFASRSDQGSKDALSPIVTAMGIHSVQSLLDKARHNVVVEGISDHYYLSAFKALLNEDEQICFLPACGVQNVPNLVSVLIGWGYNYKAVFDDDPKSGRKAYNLLKERFYEKNDELTHQHVLKIDGCNGIEDVFSPGDFAKYVLDKNQTASGGRENSELAQGKKELYARLFLEKVKSQDIKLSKPTMDKIKSVFSWLHEHLDGNAK